MSARIVRVLIGPRSAALSRTVAGVMVGIGGTAAPALARAVVGVAIRHASRVGRVAVGRRRLAAGNQAHRRTTEDGAAGHAREKRAAIESLLFGHVSCSPSNGTGMHTGNVALDKVFAVAMKPALQRFIASRAMNTALGRGCRVESRQICSYT